MSTPSYSPWNQQTKIGLALIVIGSAAIYISKIDNLFASFIGISVVVIGLRMLMTATTRARGKAIEDNAIKSLQLPPDWGMERNIALSFGGDLDILLTSPQKNQFAIEIKSYVGLIIKTSLFGSKETLVKLNGDKIKPDPLSQITKSAAEFGAAPVIWLPAAKQHKIFHLKDKTIVVQGPQRLLKRALDIT